MRAPQAAFRALSFSPARTLLTIGAISAGVATIIIMAAVGRGARDAVAAEIARMGTNLIMVTAGKMGVVAGRKRQLKEMTTLTRQDAEAIERSFPNALRVVPLKSGKVTLTHMGFSPKAALVGTTSHYPAIRNTGLSSGYFFETADELGALKVAVLGLTALRNLYPPGMDPIGTTIRVNRIPFKVIGVMEERGASISGDDEDNQIFIPLKTALRRVFNAFHINTILVQAKREDQMEGLTKGISGLLRRRHRLRGRRPNDFTIESQTELLRTREKVSARFSFMIAGASVITLFVGGLGIFAMMTIGVRRRRIEIGLRRALGATRGDILRQFLLEAVYMALCGAIAGTLIAFLVGLFIARYTGWPLSHSLWAIGIAEALALFMGVGAGVYPSWRASRIEPAEALSSLE